MRSGAVKHFYMLVVHFLGCLLGALTTKQGRKALCIAQMKLCGCDTSPCDTAWIS